MQQQHYVHDGLPAIRDGIDPENFTEYIYSKTDEDIMVDILSVLESPAPQP